MHTSTSSLTGATTSSRVSISHYNPCLPPVDVVARYTDLLKRGSETRLTRLLRAKAYVQLHDYASACADLDDWLQETDPTAHGINAGAAADRLTEALFYRGVCRARLSQVKDAVADFTEVLQRKPGHRRAHYERAACHARLDDFFNAIADYEAALQLDEVGREKENLRRYRERRHCSEQQQPRRMRSASLRPRLGPLPLGSIAVRPPSNAISPLRQQMSTPASEKGQLTDGPVAPEHSTPCSQVSTRGAMAGSGRRTSASEASDSAVAAVSLSACTMPAVGAGATTLTAILGRRNSQGFSDHSHDNLTSVSSSTESLLDGSVMKVDEMVEEASAIRTHEIAASCSSRHENSENEHGMLAAVDPTCILSSNNSEGGEWLPDDMLEAETWQQSEGSRAATRTATAGQPLLNEHYFYQRGLEHRRRGELEAAVHMYTKALELSPTHFKALFNRAFCEDRLKNYTRAIEDYTAALDLDPRNPFTHYNLGISYDHKGSPARALQAFTRAIELDDRHPDFFHNRGFTQRKQGAYAAAIADYTTAISLDPKHFKSHYNRAYCFSKLGRYEEAVAGYAAALQIVSDNANAYHNRGAALAKLGRLEAAVEDFNSALRLNPKLAFALNARGLVYDQLQQYDKALADFTEAIRLDQRNPAWLHNRGYTYRNMGELELAIADYSASIKLAPHSHTAYTNRAFAFRKLGRYEAAIEDYTKVLCEHPGVQTKVLNNRAYCFARLSLFEDAIRDYTEVLATDPVNAHALYNRGISFEKCGKYNAAVDDFTRAIRLAPEAPSTANSYYSRGTSRLQLHQVPQATEDLKQALKLDLIACGLSGEALHAFQTEHPAWRLLEDLGAD
ncbi:conserved hypothetical protein [Leishmania mexicana MHOM/GT/2001/U1103]|uniref:Uncharacterized protein n=1 Tax=Leishmania mexicana (strain MHOM/GT/2001/U1103) TaxID=929439 RepID=E9B173_LEIMU|nr:conserved hypothetical protein [Leishmania mexicana MHOM/GT/2001/U1103]CBZ28979.1 conserved hypothetical protein [Leishmania mexicana MHOM/GT/2001/U1103]